MKNITIKQIIGLVILIAATVLVTLYFAKKIINPVPIQAQTQDIEQKTPVVATVIKTRTFERLVKVQGNLESKNFAVVSPRIEGTIEQFFVDEGNTVVANESKLFRTDSIRLQQAVEIQKRLLTVAKSAKQQATANLEKTQADFNKAELDYNRFKRLYEKKVVTADVFEQQQSRYKQLKAAVKSVKASVDLAEANIEKTKADIAISEKNLEDTVIYAPISGEISRRFKESGEMGKPGEPALRIDDPNLIEVSAYIPAQYYAEVTAGQTKMQVNVSGQNMGEHEVYYKSPTINPKLRTFEVKCILENPAQTIAAGTMAEISVILETKKGLAVPTEAIMSRDNQFIVFIVSGEKAHKVPIEKGIENDGWTEVTSSELNEQSTVVTMGQNMLDEGKMVSVQRGNE
ncbi:MAG: efflux RND transporter periplasmic adaptor subunit [Phycisphaerae bacterium]|jgi:multidrug efflux pump subunit AcrA (membrane-fusion protein)